MERGWIILALLLIAPPLAFSAAPFDLAKGSHPLQQVTIDETGAVSVDADSDGIIDAGTGNAAQSAVFKLKGGTTLWSAIDFYDGTTPLWGMGKSNYDDFYIDQKDIYPPAFFIKKTTHLVGIGTDEPTEKLEVEGNIKANGDIIANRVCVGSDCKNAWPKAVSSIVTRTSSFTILPSEKDHLFLVSSSSQRTATLPDAASESGMMTTIKRTGTGNVLITPQSGQFIDGDSLKLLSSPYSSAMLISDGSNWNVLASSGKVLGTLTNYGAYKGWSGNEFASSCNEYRTSPLYTGSATGDGVYRIILNGQILDVYCDMTSSGGGWTLVLASNTNYAGWGGDDSLVTSPNTVNTNAVRYGMNAKMSTQLIDSLLLSNQVLVANGNSWTRIYGRPASNWANYIQQGTSASYETSAGATGTTTYNNYNGYYPYHFYMHSQGYYFLYGGGWGGGIVCGGGWNGNGNPSKCGVLVK